MALRKPLEGMKKRSADSGVEPDRSSFPSKEQRDQRISLFLRDFDHQAQGNLEDLKKELASLLRTAEKAFKVELLAMPVVMRQMRRKDLINMKGKETVAPATPTAVSATDCPVGAVPHRQLMRTGSKRVKVTTIVEYEDATEDETQAERTSHTIYKNKSLASLASAVKTKQGNFLSRSACSTPNVRHVEKPSGHERPASASKCTRLVSKRLPQRGLSKSASTANKIRSVTGRSTSMPPEKAVPFVNIPLADGKTLCSAGEDLQNINVELLNDDTVQHIHTLVNQLTVLCGKATVKPN